MLLTNARPTASLVRVLIVEDDGDPTCPSILHRPAFRVIVIMTGPETNVSAAAAEATLVIDKDDAPSPWDDGDLGGEA